MQLRQLCWRFSVCLCSLPEVVCSSAAVPLLVVLDSMLMIKLLLQQISYGCKGLHLVFNAIGRT